MKEFFHCKAAAVQFLCNTNVFGPSSSKMFLVRRGEKTPKFETKQFLIISIICDLANTVAKCTARITNSQYIKVAK